MKPKADNSQPRKLSTGVAIALDKIGFTKGIRGHQHIRVGIGPHWGIQDLRTVETPCTGCTEFHGGNENAGGCDPGCLRARWSHSGI